VTERWLPVVGAEGRYEVSDLGNVRSVDHRVRLVCHGVETTRQVHGRKLRPAPSRSGHLSAVIGKGNTRLVHQLVLEAFVGPRPVGFETLHLNHQPADNRLENLVWGPRSENLRMDWAAGRRVVPANFIGARWRA
jgi:hypothetical protein